MTVSIVTALGRDGIIGVGAELPWPRIPADMKFFSELTADGIVIMGRKTWDSIPAKIRPLPGRINVIITRNPNFFPEHHDDVHVYRAFSRDVIRDLQDAYPGKDVFIIGGAEIYKTALTERLFDFAYITRVGCPEEQFKGPEHGERVYFPEDLLINHADIIRTRELTKTPFSCVVEFYKPIDSSNSKNRDIADPPHVGPI